MDSLGPSQQSPHRHLDNSLPHQALAVLEAACRVVVLRKLFLLAEPLLRTLVKLLLHHVLRRA